MDWLTRLTLDGWRALQWKPSPASNKEFIRFYPTKIPDIITLQRKRNDLDAEVELTGKPEEGPYRPTKLPEHQRINLRTLFGELCQEFPEVLEWPADDSMRDAEGEGFIS